MIPNRRVLVSAAIVAAGGLAAVLLLWPSDQSSGVAASDPAALVPLTKRRPLAPVSGAALTAPPARLALRQLGRPMVVDVWASWCVPCKEEAPMLAALHRSYGARIRFLGIDVEDTRAAARAFERRYRIGYPSIFDERAALAGRLGFYGLPTAYLVDRQGRIAATLVGKQRESVLRAKLKLLVGESG